MAKSTQLWLFGCGGGCLLLVLVVGAVFFSGAYFVRDTMKGFEQAVDTQHVLDEQFGSAADFTPWPTGGIPPSRLEAFLAVREASMSARQQVAAALDALPSSEEEARELENKPSMEKMSAVFDIVRSSVGLGSGIGTLFEARNEALLAAEMGVGEYTYLYILVFQIALGHPLNDSGDSLPMQMTSSTRVRSELRGMLRRQLEALPADAPAAWREELTAEVAALEADPQRLAWQDGLPAVTEVSIASFRERLAATYQPQTNPFELGLNERRKRWNIEVQ